MAHDSRWALDLPATGALKLYCRDVLDRIRARLVRTPDDDAALYPYRLVLAHEDMHGEALLYTLQTLGVTVPMADMETAARRPGEIAVDGATFLCGGQQSRGFVFDNERQAAVCPLAPFTIDMQLVSNAAYLTFMRDGSYQRPGYWSADGRAWLQESERSAPRYWKPGTASDDWHTLRFGRPVALDPLEPVRHVNLYEAEAYCNWAGRRLPLEQEWECAATSGGPGFGWGELWEWTASRFEPYAGFKTDRYRPVKAPCCS